MDRLSPPQNTPLRKLRVGSLQIVGPEQRLKEGGHAGDDVGLFLLEQLGVGLHVELGHQNAAGAAHQGRVDADAQTEAVEDRHDREHFQAVDGGEAAGGNGLQGQRV